MDIHRQRMLCYAVAASTRGAPVHDSGNLANLCPDIFPNTSDQQHKGERDSLNFGTSCSP